MKNKRLFIILAVVISLLLIPFIAMRTGVDGVVWTAMDFITMGVMLTCTAFGIEFALRIFKGRWVKVAGVIAVLFAFVMVWGTLVHMGG